MADGHISADQNDAAPGEHRSAVLKAIDISARSRDIDPSQNIDAFADESRMFVEAGALVPPYPPRTLWDLYESSSVLRQCVEAYKSNIDGHGHHLEAVIDLDSDDVHDRVASAIYLERLAARDRGQVVVVQMPSEQEVEAKINEIADAMKLEAFRIDSFFESCTVDQSFVGLRRETRGDLEVTGNAYWEVLRDSRERAAQFERLPSQTMRVMRLERELVEVIVPMRTGPLSMGTERVKRRFRKFVQIIGTKRVFFKQYGDPRTMSASTGRFFDNELELKAKEGDKTCAATEVMHFRIEGPGAYGIPRWIGALLAVLGTRHAEEVNVLYFTNKAVPPMALLVSGATVSSDSVKRIESYIENNLRGIKNFHKILIIEAESQQSSDPDAAPPGRIRIELKPLTQAQQNDALFQKYDERNADKVGMQFRLPRLLRGDVRDFNRATAEACIEFADGQVFNPERVEFDSIIDKAILRGELLVRYWQFRSNGVQVRDPARVAEMIERLTRANALVPADGRQLAEELVFNRKLRRIDADWQYQPPMLTQVGVPADSTRDGTIPANPAIGAGGTPNPNGRQDGGPLVQPIRFAWSGGGGRRRMAAADLAHTARELIRLRDALEAEEARDELEALVAAKKGGSDADPKTPTTAPERSTTTKDDGPQEERITMPIDEMVTRFALVVKPGA